MRTLPPLPTDTSAEFFLVRDLSILDFTQFREINREARPKSARLTVRLPKGLMTALKAKAKQQGIPYQRLVREAIERELARDR